MRPTFPPNPFRRMLGIEIEIPQRGRCEATMPGLEASRDATGLIAQGAVATLCDITMGHAIGAQTTANEPFATVHLQIAFHEAAGSGPLRGAGRCPALSPGWKEAMAACEIRRDDGGLVATAQGFFARRPPGAERPAEPPAWEGAAPQSLSALLGLRVVGEELRMEVGGALLNPDAVGHGGALAAALDSAMRHALAQRGAGEAIALRTLDVRYILPALPGEVAIVPQVDRKGRAIHFAQARALGADGRTLCAAVGIYGGRLRS
ncbi:MAG: hypothetical protein M0Z66_08460 [Thermaerobacter sp.]|nr:hypothetical protein [Thermaerobacter sp.]